VAQTAKEFFEALPERVNGSGHASGMHTTYVFDIAGSGVWTVKVDDGKVEVSEGDAGGDCTVSTSEATFQKLIEGRQNPVTAYMTGKLKVKGDMDAALKLKEILG
jgi:putative sterol carrier protein